MFSNHNYIFCPRIVLERLHLQFFYGGKISCEAQFAFPLRHLCRSPSSSRQIHFIPAYCDKSNRDAGIKLWVFSRFGTSGKLIQTRVSFIPVFFFRGLPIAIRVCPIFEEVYKICGQLLNKASMLQTRNGCLCGAHVDCEATLACSARIKDSAEDEGRYERLWVTGV